MKRIGIAAFAVCAGVIVAPMASQAQVWQPDRALTQGRGVRFGDFEFHPGLAAEVGYDSNALLRSVSAAGALRLRFSAQVALQTIGPQRARGTQRPVNFRVYAQATYNRYIPVDMTDPGTVTNASNLGFGVGFRADILPGRTWTFSIFDDFNRRVPGSGTEITAVSTYNRFHNAGGLALGWNPSSGIIGLQLAATNRFEIFEAMAVQAFNSMSTEISLSNRWRFLPQTAFIWDAMVAPTFYFNSAGGPVTLPASHPMRVRFGLNGLFTERFGLMALVGYHGSFRDLGDNVDTIVAQLEARYVINPLSTFLGGVMRDVQPDYLSGWVVRNRAYIDYSHSFSGRFLLSLRFGAGLMQYGCITVRATGQCDMSGRIQNIDPMTQQFNTFRVEGLAFGEYRFTDWFGMNLTLGLSTNLGDVAVQSGAMMIPLTWVKFEAFFGLRVNY